MVKTLNYDSSIGDMLDTLTTDGVFKINNYLEFSLTAMNVFNDIHKEMIGGANKGEKDGTVNQTGFFNILNKSNV